MNALTAMKQALDALNECSTPIGLGRERVARRGKAITNLRTAITEMERVEPVAWVKLKDESDFTFQKPIHEASYLKLFTHPQDRDSIIEECAAIADELAIANREQETDSMWEFYECAAAIRSLKGKK